MAPRSILLGGMTILLSVTVAHAEPVASRNGGTVYVLPVAPAPTAPATAIQAQAASNIGESNRRGRHRWAWRHEHRVQEAAATMIETTPAPTPSGKTSSTATDAQAKTTDTDGPHESAAPTIKDLVSKHAKENGVPENLAAAVVRIESRFNPNARGGGALGLMQIKFQTARSAGFVGSASGLMQPDTNLHYGMKVLADAYKASNGNVCMTLARYQSGRLTTRMSAANRAYCSRARAIMATL